MNIYCKKLKAVIEETLKRHNKLEDFNTKNEFHLRIEKEGFQPLVIEKHGNRVMITHYYEQNGDLVPDPDMELLINENNEWLPVAIQFATGHYVKAMAWQNDKLFANQNEMLEQVCFSNMWASNLKWQKY